MILSRTQTQKGFTLIELMIAITILAILADVGIPAFMAYQERARVSATKSNMSLFKNAIMLYQGDTGQYPKKLQDLIKAPRDDERVAKKWGGPYIEAKNSEALEDGWSNRFQYKVTPGSKYAYELFSYGPNGKGAPKTEHISVWDE